MRIVTFDFAGRAPAVELGRALAARGHDVLHLYSADAQSPKWDLIKHTDDPARFSVRALALGSPPAERRLFARFLFWGRYGRAFAQAAQEFKPDVVLATSSTLFLHRAFRAAFTRHRVQFVYWMQRFYFRRYDQTLRTRSRLTEALLSYWVRRIEANLLRGSDVLIVPAEYLLAMLDEGWGIGARQCMVVRNWAPIERLRPGEKVNAWAKEHGIAAPCVVMYTGSLDEERRALLLACAERLRRQEDVALITVSDAPSAALLAREAQARGLRNLTSLPFQDYAVYPQVLASADVLLCLVQSRDGVLKVPSKLTFYLCAGRAVVLAAPSENLAADIMRESGAGLVVPPGDIEAICAAVRNLAGDAAARVAAQTRARAYAEQNFEIGKIADRFERLFQRIVEGPARQT